MHYSEFNGTSIFFGSQTLWKYYCGTRCLEHCIFIYIFFNGRGALLLGQSSSQIRSYLIRVGNMMTQFWISLLICNGIVILSHLFTMYANCYIYMLIFIYLFSKIISSVCIIINLNVTKQYKVIVTTLKLKTTNQHKMHCFLICFAFLLLFRI